MNLDLATNKLTVKDTTVEVFIPDNPKAQLMYYLNCISEVLMTDKLSRYTNYQKYYLIPDSELPDIVALALIFNPEIMMESKIFIPTDYLRLGNQFFEITNETMGIHANQEMVIGGIAVRVVKVMLCTQSWITKFYINPIDNILNPPPPPLPIFKRRRHYSDDDDCDDCGCNIF